MRGLIAAASLVLAGLLGALLILITSPVVSPRPAHAQVEALETWHCFSRYDSSQAEVLFTLYRYRLGVNGGRVSGAGVSYPAKFSVAGLERRWDFVLSADGSYTYMFLIKPAGRGLYFDFTTSEDGTATSRAHYTCRSS